MPSFMVTDKNIADFLEKHEIVILNFWASWCGPCKNFSPIYESVSNANPDIFFGKVNSETELLLSSDFAIQSVPTLIILKEKTIIFEQNGAIPEYLLNDIIKKSRLINVEELENEED